MRITQALGPMALMLAAASSHGATFTVTTTNATGAGSLEQAILDANANNNNATIDLIDFNIAGTGNKIITPPTAGFTAISEPVLIDGLTQGDASANTAATGSNAVLRVVLDRGTSTIDDPPSSVFTFAAGSDNSTVRGIVFREFIPLGQAMITVEDDGIDIEGNYFGITETGNADGGNVPSDMIRIAASANNTSIGSAALADRNLFGAGFNGIVDFGIGTTIQNNQFGLGANNSSVLAFTGGLIALGGDDALVGGLAANQGNRLFNTDSRAIAVTGADSTGNEISGNTFNNVNDPSGQIINLVSPGEPASGATANDLTDSDTGANNLQNFPVLASADFINGTTTISGSLRSTLSTQFRIEFYEADAATATGGLGRGERFIGSTLVTTNGIQGLAAFSFDDNSLTDGDFITATATNTVTGDTSEFSATVTAVRPPFVVTNANPSGAGSLAQAIHDANARAGADRIEFDIPAAVSAPVTIDLGSGTLPNVTEQLTIDGYSQNGSVVNTSALNFNATIRIEVRTTALNAMVWSTTANGSLLRGLAFVDGAVVFQSSSTQVTGCQFGSGPSGAFAESQIGLSQSANNFRLGGAALADRNLIENYSLFGVFINGAGGVVIEGNNFGLDPAGSASRGPSGTAVVVDGGSTSVRIGGVVSATRNRIVVDQSDRPAIDVCATCTGVHVQSNTYANVSSEPEIAIDLLIDEGIEAVSLNDVGDLDGGANNGQNFPVLSGAGRSGANTLVTGRLESAPSRQYRIQLYSSVTGNGLGYGTGETLIDEFLQSTDANGRLSFARPLTAVPLGHLITAMAIDQVTLESSEFSNAVPSTDQAFLVSNTNDSGAGSLRAAIQSANATAALDFIGFDAVSTGLMTITPTSAGLPNISNPLIIDGYTHSLSRPNNTDPGTDAVIMVELSGLGLPTSDADGFEIGSHDVTIRGLAIYGFDDGDSVGNTGVSMQTNASVFANKVFGNFIGMRADGAAATGNQHGVETGSINAANHQVGSVLIFDRNVISGNRRHGVIANGVGIEVSNNYIGVDKDDLNPRPNGENGVQSAATGALISENRIAFNGQDGIAIVGDADGVSLFGNSISDNGDLGIDIGPNGINTNDADDLDTGPNGLVNAPALVTLSVSSVQVFLDMAGNQTVTLQYFRSPTCDGEGKTLTAIGQATLDASGSAVFTQNLGSPAAGAEVTAIVTDAAGNSSEFSACAQPLPTGDAVFSNGFE